MSFLQPLLLAGLPLIALPILIHLINQRRYQTIHWAAMMFLLAANRMSRGYAKLRQWLILVARMLAIAGLIFAVSRPLASGWLGLTAGGRADTTIILLDRSPSMQQQGQGTVGSKLETGRQQLARTLNMLGSARWVLIDSTTNLPSELESPDALLRLPAAEPTSTSADLPAMLEAARDYVRENKSGRTEIWICSDIRHNDWNAESGRWQSLRDSFLEFSQGVRFHLLAYSQPAADNVSVRVTNVRRRQTGDSAELLVSLRLSREEFSAGVPGVESSSPQATPTSTAAGSKSRPHPPTPQQSLPPVNVPIQFEIEGARSEQTVEMVSTQFDLQDHRIPIERTRERGWGRVSIPADANPADNEFYFVFDQPPVRQTIIVADDAVAARPLQLAASIAPDPALRCVAEVIARDQLPTVEWERVALVFWQAPLPDGNAADAIESFVNRGGQVVFLPTRGSDDGEFLGAKWGDWVEEKAEVAIESWRGDQDLLANTQSGAALPVGQLQVHNFRTIDGELTPLATLKGASPLIARVPTQHGGVYFCATTPAPNDSSLATNGVVLYVFVQRALATGASVLGNTRQLVAGDAATERSAMWHQIVGPPDAISTDFAFHRGVYSAGERLLAVNRSAAEDQSPVLADDRVTALFQGLDFARVDDQAGSLSALIQEIWRLFLAAMIVALIIEAALCLPKLGRPATTGLASVSAATIATDNRPVAQANEFAETRA
jgi:hypothetical protein